MSPITFASMGPRVAGVISAVSLDSAKTYSGTALSNGNLTATQGTATTWGASIATVSSANDNIGIIRMYQVHIDSMDAPGYTSVGLCNVSGDFNNAPGNDGNSAGYNSLGQVVFGFSVVATYASFSAGDTISLAINSGFLFVRVNSGNWNNNASVDPTNASSGLGGIVNSLGTPPAQLYPMIGVYDTGRTVTVNLGGTAYSPAAPVGALNFGA